MIKKYICHFRQGTVHQTLTFNIEHSPVSEVWCSLLGDSEPSSLQTVFPRNKQFMRAKFDELLEWLDIIGIDFPRDINTVTREHLNDLHKQFQLFEETAKGMTRRREAFKQVNFLVHAVETMLVGSTAKHYAVWASESYNKRIEITDELRTCWSTATVSRPAGALYLGYATTGKNLRHAFNDNDVALVKENGLRPQQFITSEVSLLCDPVMLLDSKFRLSQIQVWAKRNNLEIDLNNPSNIYCDSPFLGQADTSSAELEDLFTNYEFYKITIE